MAAELRIRGDEHFRASTVLGRAPVLVVDDVKKAIFLYSQAAEAAGAHDDRALAEEKLGIANAKLATFEAKNRVLLLSRALSHFLCAVSLRAQVDAGADAAQWYDAIKTKFLGSPGSLGSLERLVDVLRGTELRAALVSMDGLVRKLANIQRPAGSIVPGAVFAEMQFKARLETARLHFRSAELAVEADKYADAVAELQICRDMLCAQPLLPDEADLEREEYELLVESKQVRRAPPAGRSARIAHSPRSCKTAACDAGRASRSSSALPRLS